MSQGCDAQRMGGVVGEIEATFHRVGRVLGIGQPVQPRSLAFTCGRASEREPGRQV
jgi:hypothetical protein